MPDGGTHTTLSADLLCVGCGSPVAPILARLGSLHCHDCRTDQLTGALLGVSGSTGEGDWSSSVSPMTGPVREGSGHRPEAPRSALDAGHPVHPLTETPSSAPGWPASNALTEREPGNVESPGAEEVPHDGRAMAPVSPPPSRSVSAFDRAAASPSPESRKARKATVEATPVAALSNAPNPTATERRAA